MRKPQDYAIFELAKAAFTATNDVLRKWYDTGGATQAVIIILADTASTDLIVATGLPDDRTRELLVVAIENLDKAEEQNWARLP